MRRRCAPTHPATVVVEGDATTVDDNVAAVDAVVDRHGGLDVLVSCVGLFDFYRGVGDLDADDVVPAFDELFHANVAVAAARRARRARRPRRPAAAASC